MKNKILVRPNFKLPYDLHDRFKKTCVLKNLSMQDVVLTLIKDFVKKNSKGKLF